MSDLNPLRKRSQRFDPSLQRSGQSLCCGTIATEPFRQVIENQRFLEDEMLNGDNILIQNSSDKSVRKVVFNTPPKRRRVPMGTIFLNLKWNNRNKLRQRKRGNLLSPSYVVPIRHVHRRSSPQ